MNNIQPIWLDLTISGTNKSISIRPESVSILAENSKMGTDVTLINDNIKTVIEVLETKSEIKQALRGIYKELKKEGW